MGANLITPILTPYVREGTYDNPPIPPEGSGRDQPVNLLNVRHPEYSNRMDAWLDLSLLYEGGAMLKAHSDRLLKKRPREDEEVYAARMDHITYQNILGTALGWYGAVMFETDPEIFFNSKSGSPPYTEFLENCDGLGMRYIDFFKKAFQTLLTYGASWVITDLPALEDGENPPQTLEEERQRGFLDPHVCNYSPLSVINWQVDRQGKLKWAVMKTEQQEQQFLMRPEIVSRWYYYDREHYEIYEDRRQPEEALRVADEESGRMAKFIREGKHALSHVGRLPLRRLTLTDGLWLANRAYLQLMDHLNQDNTFSWALFMSNLAIPVVIGDVDANNMTYSETGYLQFPSGTEYGWSEPEGKSFTHSAKRVESLREECYRSLNLQQQGRSMRATPAMQSGRSKILEMAPSNQILNGMGDDIRRHMQDILKDIRDARHEPDVEPDVRGFSFKEDMTTEEVYAASSVLNMRIPSRTFEKFVMKKIVKVWMTDANRVDLVRAYDEVESGPTIEEQNKKDLQMKMDAARTSMKSALTPNGSLPMPPGRGGAGPSVKSTEGQGREKR